MTRDEIIAKNEQVKQYIDARIHLDTLRGELEEMKKKVEQANLDMQEKWRLCRDAHHGVYAFKDHGRWGIVLIGTKDALVDYHPLVFIN